MMEMKSGKRIGLLILLIFAAVLFAGNPSRVCAADGTGIQPYFNRVYEPLTGLSAYREVLQYRTSMPDISRLTAFRVRQSGSQASFNRIYDPLTGLSAYREVPQYRTSMPDISRLTAFSVRQSGSQVLFSRSYGNLHWSGITAAQIPASEPAANAASEPASNRVSKPTSRTVFFGDSRTVDMFSNSAVTIPGELHNGILVLAYDGARFSDMESNLNRHGVDSFDTLISWMGGNDGGNFAPYQSYYEGLLAKGKRLVLCTVGPTNEALFPPGANPLFLNANIIRYNRQLKEWSAKNGVKVIDLHSFIQSESGVRYDRDGLHYSPKPNRILWNYILSQLQQNSEV